jgi:parallel beta-helix repeat protein
MFNRSAKFGFFVLALTALTLTSGVGAQSTYTLCAKEGAFCSFTGTKDVRYGANGSYFTQTFTDGVACTNTVFGDPIPGTYKYCFTSDTDTTTTPPATTTTTDFGAVVQGIRPRGFGAIPYVMSLPTLGRAMYYVATTGSDSNVGTYLAPFRTINKAAQVALAGDVVTIRNGTYQESVSIRNSGASDKRIVFQAENRGGVVLTGGQYSFQPAAWNGGKLATGQFYITVKGLIFRQYTSSADGQAALRAVNGWRIEDCLFDNPGRNGLDLRGDSIVLTQSTIQYALQHAFIAWGPTNGATSPTDPVFEGILDLRLTDLILAQNFHMTSTSTATSQVTKILGSKGALVDNIESYGNYGNGLWFDTDNVGYVVRNSYFHDNLWLGSGYSPGRGLHLEISWAGLVESNVFANNEHEGLAVNNSQGVTVRNNLFIGNMRSIRLSNGDRGTSHVLKDIRLEYNQFKQWRQYGGIEPLGDLLSSSLSSRNITADYNVYEPLSGTWLSGWWGSPAYGITTISGMQTYLGWEQTGGIAQSALPY